MSKLINKEEKI